MLKLNNFKTVQEICPNKVWIINDQFVLKKMKNNAIKEKNIIAASILNKSQIPSFVCVDFHTNMEFADEQDNNSYLLMTRIPGHHLKKEEFLSDENTLFLSLGKVLSSMHQSINYSELSNVVVSHDLMKEYDFSVEKMYKFGLSVPKYIVSRYNTVKQCYYSLPKFIIHRDVQPRNIMFDNKSISGLLDYDSFDKDIRVIDLVYWGLSTLQIIDIRDTCSIKQWRKHFNSTLQSYSILKPLSFTETDIINDLFYVLQICSSFQVLKK